jgi:rRNA maturation RNase YbeY
LRRFASSVKGNAKIYVAFVDDPTIQELNRSFKNLKNATNVLSFEINQEDPEDGTFIIGEIIVSVDTAKTEAADAGMPAVDRLTELFIHGLVHLSGYDHTINKKEAVRMKRKEKELMEKIHTIEKNRKRRA